MWIVDGHRMEPCDHALLLRRGGGQGRGSGAGVRGGCNLSPRILTLQHSFSIISVNSDVLKTWNSADRYQNKENLRDIKTKLSIPVLLCNGNRITRYSNFPL